VARRDIRRSQLVVPFGVGSIIEFEDEALMPAGLDVWPDLPGNRIHDERLARRLGVRYFVAPPPKPESGGPRDQMSPVPCVRFPRWHFCPRCRALKKVDLFANRRPRCDNPQVSPRFKDKSACGEVHEKRRPRVLPVRFVAVCPAGHIEDFPWHAWAHSKAGEELYESEKCKPELLYFYATRAGGLSGLRVQCGLCGESRSLLGSTSREGLKGWKCRGSRPWLGEEQGSEPCMAKPVADDGGGVLTLQRGASNLYFAEVASSILIPPHSTRIGRILGDPTKIGILKKYEPQDAIPDELFQMAAQGRVDWRELKKAYEARKRIEGVSEGAEETSFRRAEYQALQRDRREEGDELECRTQPIADYGPLVKEAFRKVMLVEKLTETRALTGFSRIQPTGEFRAALSRESVRWRPAFRVRGEGLFLELSQPPLEAFERRASGRLSTLTKRAIASDRVPLQISPRLVLLHSLAHLLIKRLSFEAGYGASSIRERIYCATGSGGAAMAGILLYTAAGDADGTLGGLVALGRTGTLDRVVAGAVEEARWCGSDPICIESSGQGPDSLNLAACHACALLPETSCELQNRVLDRRAVLEFFGI
jgi:hypothetical protein